MQHQQTSDLDRTAEESSQDKDLIAVNVCTLMDVLLDSDAKVPYETLDNLMSSKDRLLPLIQEQVYSRINSPSEIREVIYRLKGYHTTVEAQITGVTSREKLILEELNRAKTWILDFFRPDFHERLHKEAEHIKLFNDALLSIEQNTSSSTQLHNAIKNFSRLIDKRYRIHFLSPRAEELVRSDHYSSRIYDEEVPRLIEEYRSYTQNYLSLSKATSLALIAPALSESDPKGFFHKCSLLIASEPNIGVVLTPLAEWINFRLGSQTLLNSTSQRLQSERMDFGVAVDFWVKALESCVSEVTSRYDTQQVEQARLQQEEMRQRDLARYHELSSNVIHNLLDNINSGTYVAAYRSVDDSDKQSILEQLAPEFEALLAQPTGLSKIFSRRKSTTLIEPKILQTLCESFLEIDINELNNQNVSDENLVRLKTRIAFLASRMSESSRKAALDNSYLSIIAHVRFSSLIFELKSHKLTPKTWNEAVASTELI